MVDTRDLGHLRRIVVKLGSRVVTSQHLEALVEQICRLVARDIEVVLVSSGAVATGMEIVGLTERPKELSQLQALAAIGQADLLGRYNTMMATWDRRCAQVLLTHENISHRRHAMNVLRTLEDTLALGVLPVVNENDSVATEELRFGDNDRLAASLASLLGADLVILLSDVDALYDRNPQHHETAQPLHEVYDIDDDVIAMAGASSSAVGTGGMASKVYAAQVATEGGVPLIVVGGHVPKVLTRLLSGEVLGTRFQVSANPRINRRQHWIMHLSKVNGTIVVDKGAEDALRRRGSSLLAIGVVSARGQFQRGDAVEIVSSGGSLIAKGLIGCDDETLRRIKGLRSEEIFELLGMPAVGSVVHRNDLVLQSN